MLPFVRMLKYGNEVIDPGSLYVIGGGSNSVLIFNPITNTLYGRALTSIEIGLYPESGAKNDFVKVATNVKRLLTVRDSGSGFNAYLSTDDKIYFAGNDAALKGSIPTQTNYNGWTDKTSMFTSAGIEPSEVKEIQAWYSLKLNVIMNNGDLYCAGKNNIASQSSFGTGNNTDSNYALVKVPISNVKAADGNVYLTYNGEVYITGTNGKYQYGDGTTVSSPGLTKIVDSGVVDIRTGYQNTYYLDSSGIMYGCGTQFGLTYGNEFGTGSAGPYVYKTFIQMRSGVKKIDSCRGNMSTLCVTSDNKLYSTGLNPSGMFGTGNTSNTYVFTVAIGALVITDAGAVQTVRTNSGTMVLSAGKLYQTGIKYGSGMGVDTIYVEIPLTFMN